MEKPSLPRGTRDFGPADMFRRRLIFDTIRKVFETFGYQPLETPAMENLSTLTGKYGEEGDQLLFRILNSGDIGAGIASLKSPDTRTLLPLLSEKGLRYDLTVPFARYVVMNRDKIVFPFKRYQMQPVWRADRPQKGRYREFYQCDADVIGTDSILCEAEIVLMINRIFQQLDIVNYTIRINHRGLLAGLAETIGGKGKEPALYTAIDKLDKMGETKVREELSAKGFSSPQLDQLFSALHQKGDNEALIQFAEHNLQGESVNKAVTSLRELTSLLNAYGPGEQDHLQLDFSLARGLSYYTATIFEVVLSGVAVGSVSGGGRYDDLTGIFGMPGISGVGISFGVDRLYDAMDELQLFGDVTAISSKVLICTMDPESKHYGLSLLHDLREAGVASELYPDEARMKKQLDFANRKGIPFVIVIGENERTTGMLALKEMASGNQENISRSEVLKLLAR
jgi:histidyl-tRNA synthetase